MESWTMPFTRGLQTRVPASGTRSCRWTKTDASASQWIIRLKQLGMKREIPHAWKHMLRVASSCLVPHACRRSAEREMLKGRRRAGKSKVTFRVNPHPLRPPHPTQRYPASFSNEVLQLSYLQPVLLCLILNPVHGMKSDDQETALLVSTYVSLVALQAFLSPSRDGCRIACHQQDCLSWPSFCLTSDRAQTAPSSVIFHTLFS